jgi:hypothetical protein
MNLQQFRWGIERLPIEHRATILVETAVLLIKFQAADFVTGKQLERAAFGYEVSREQAVEFYNAIEDVLTTSESHRKQEMKVVASRFGPEFADMMNQRTELQQQSLRLILVALARKADESFKVKVQGLSGHLLAAKESILAATSNLQREDTLSASLGIAAERRDYEEIALKAELVVLSLVGW